MIVVDLLSLICNDSNYSLAQIWIVNDLSTCYYKFFFGFLLHFLTLLVVAYNLGQRLSSPYHLWTFPLALIRLSSSIILISTCAFYFYSCFFLDTAHVQWIDVIDTSIIITTYIFLNYLNFNRNLYHPTRPWSLSLILIVLFLSESYDFYRIAIDHTTLIESIYISIRQLCLALITLGLLVICQHRCQRSERRTSKYMDRSIFIESDRVSFQLMNSMKSNVYCQKRPFVNPLALSKFCRWTALMKITQH